MTTCTTCGTEVSAAARFCSACGAPVAVTPEREVRKTVTLLFCDVSGSTRLGERLDPELLRHALRRYFEEIESVIVSHGGLVEKFVGDAVMAVFGLPTAHEDDALRAVRAAVEVRERLPAIARETGVELAFRTGVNTGEVVTGLGQTLATGDAVNVAARLQQTASPEEILLGATTEALVRGHVDAELLAPLEVRGRAGPVVAYRLRGLAAEEPRRLVTGFVGRDRELRLLRDAFDRTLEARELHLFTLLGPAGIGKSRLAGEFVASLGHEPVVAAGRCLSYGLGITYRPLVEILEQLGEEGHEARRRVLEGSATSPEELAWSLRHFLEGVAQERPLVLLVDDLHWAQPALLDLLDRMAELSRDAPILLLCLARPELLEERPTWAGGRLNATTLLLDALPAADARTLVGQLESDLGEDERTRIVEVGGGNPLFLEELVAYRGETGSIEAPPLIQALLQARLDRLPRDERLVVECAAVVGTTFHRDAVAALAQERLRPAVDAHLRALTVKELVRPGRENGSFSFRHELICERAYAALPKGERARLHEAAAEWLDERGAELSERDALVGYHLERAALARRELGAPDEALESRAAQRLAGAAHAARRLTDFPGAADLWSRALALLGDDDPARAPVAVELAFLSFAAADIERGSALLDDAERLGDEVCVARARVVRLYRLVNFEPDTAPAAVARERERSVPVLAAAGDEQGLAVFWMAAGFSEWLEGHGEASAAALEEQARHAAAAGDRCLEADGLTGRLGHLAVARIPHTETLAEWARLRARFPGEPIVEIGELASWAAIALHDRRLAEARELSRRLVSVRRRLGEELEAVSWRAEFDVEVERAAGDLEEAARISVEAMDELRRRGERSFRSYHLCLLARVRLEQGSAAEAVELTREAEAVGAALDTVTQVEARAVRARALACLGEAVDAEATARDAVARARATDFLLMHADAAFALAEALAAAGDEDGSRDAAEEAVELYERKGLKLYAERARALLSTPVARS